MTDFSLALDSILTNITTIASTITGIRRAYNYDEWADAPTGMFNRDQAMHLTGFLEEGDGWRYYIRGQTLDEFEFSVPLYTVVLAASQIRTARSWVSAFPDRYATAYRGAMTLSGTTTVAIYFGGRVVRSIPDFPGYDGFYMLRHDLRCHVKGAATHTA